MEKQRGAIAYFGDFLGLQDSPEILAIIRQTGDTKIIFTDMVNKVNKRDKVQVGRIFGESLNFRNVLWLSPIELSITWFH